MAEIKIILGKDEINEKDEVLKITKNCDKSHSKELTILDKVYLPCELKDD